MANVDIRVVRLPRKGWLYTHFAKYISNEIHTRFEHLHVPESSSLSVSRPLLEEECGRCCRYTYRRCVNFSVRPAFCSRSTSGKNVIAARVQRWRGPRRGQKPRAMVEVVL